MLIAFRGVLKITFVIVLLSTFIKSAIPAPAIKGNNIPSRFLASPFTASNLYRINVSRIKRAAYFAALLIFFSFIICLSIDI